jgi:hypothetical protein
MLLVNSAVVGSLGALKLLIRLRGRFWIPSVLCGSNEDAISRPSLRLCIIPRQHIYNRWPVYMNGILLQYRYLVRVVIAP